jgi:succinoglycan biosynthesis protein ExoM
MRTVRVRIAIPTFRRPALLRVLLAGIALQQLPVNPPKIGVDVLDNDPQRSAEGVVAALRQGFPFPLAYESVPTPGLSEVRNRALARARDVDFLIMIDDDEVPEQLWLSELLRVERETGADAVIGPVPALIPSDAPRWLREFRGAHLPGRGDGSPLADGWSGNCLLRMATLSRLRIAFDRAFNLCGGEDQLFFRQMSAQGARIVYASAATAWEHTPAERTTLSFFLRREYRRGNTLALCERHIDGTARTAALRCLKGMARILFGVLGMLPRSALCGKSGAVASCAQAAGGAGMLAGLIGIRYQAYARPIEGAVR